MILQYQWEVRLIALILKLLECCVFSSYIGHMAKGCSSKSRLTLMLLVTNLTNTKWCKRHEKWLKPWHMVLIWEISARAFWWIPTWQGLDGFQKYLHPSALRGESSLNVGSVNETYCYRKRWMTYAGHTIHTNPKWHNYAIHVSQ